jgi:hypothetical protein
MGFDFYITLSMMMCHRVGKPFYYGKDEATGHLKRVYELPKLNVPDNLKEYLQQRGHHFHAYIHRFEEENSLIHDVSVAEFLEGFPTWEQVKQADSFKDQMFGYKEEEEDSDSDCWSRKDHECLLRLLTWCNEQPYDFRVSWSY